MSGRLAIIAARDEAVKELARSIAKYRAMKKTIIGNPDAALVLKQLKELRKRSAPVDASSRGWRGYDSRAYGKTTREKLDTAVAQLCEMLTNQPDLRVGGSLELQAWWRDHQAADAKAAEAAKRRRDEALAKLTPEEREALGVKE